MNNFSKKQKIIVVIISCIIIGIVSYYFYNIENDFNIISAEETDLNSNTGDTTKKKTNKDTDTINESYQNDENESYQNEGIESYKKEAEKIIVHISGAVVNEGIVELKNNSRVSDAIEKAGGLKEDANIKDINLAYKLEDGMKIHIPNNAEQEEKENKRIDLQENFQSSNMSDYITTSNEKQSDQILYNSSKELKVNINTATQTELETLPGIGPSTALKIINYRKENGNFTSVDAIKEVSGIGEAKFDNIKDFIVI